MGFRLKPIREPVQIEMESMDLVSFEGGEMVSNGMTSLRSMSTADVAEAKGPDNGEGTCIHYSRPTLLYGPGKCGPASHTPCAIDRHPKGVVMHPCTPASQETAPYRSIFATLLYFKVQQCANDKKKYEVKKRAQFVRSSKMTIPRQVDVDKTIRSNRVQPINQSNDSNELDTIVSLKSLKI